MKILFDILHPAHVHFFRNTVWELVKRGHEVLITARDKDLTLKLLSLYKIPFQCISEEAESKIGLIRELAMRNLRLFRVVLREKPDTLVSIGGISTAQVGFLSRTRNLTFYDTENATVSNFLSYPFSTEVITPECYRKRVFGRHMTYPGYHELAYLYPTRFTRDPSVLQNAGVDPQEPYSVVRFVSWRALHDVKAKGFSIEEKIDLVRALEKFGSVFITSESRLPGELEHCKLQISPDKVHHLLAFARLFIGESATMASESVVLGTPAIYIDAVGRGYTDEQEQRYDLCFNFRPWNVDKAIAKAGEVLSRDLKNDPDYKTRVKRMLSEKIDVTEFIIGKLIQGKAY